MASVTPTGQLGILPSLSQLLESQINQFIKVAAGDSLSLKIKQLQLWEVRFQRTLVYPNLTVSCSYRTINCQI